MKIKSLLCLLSLLAGTALHAQSVTTTGEVYPDHSPNSGASWDMGDNNLIVGSNSTGTLSIAGGGTVTSGGADNYVGYNMGSDGTVTVDGAGSLWTLSQSLSVGHSGQGHLFIQNGGEVSLTNGANLILGNGYGAGDVTVTGAGSALNVAGTVTIGDIGTQTSKMTITNGGIVSVNGGAGTLTIANQTNGTLNFGSEDLANPTTTGTLNAASIVFGYGDSAVMNFNQTDKQLTVSATISGAGTIYQRGRGATTLSGDNSDFWGDIKVNDGTLEITSTTNAQDITVSGTAGAAFRVTTSGVLSANDFYIANEGGGHLRIDRGGQATNNVATIGANNHTGSVTVSGAGSTWTLDQNLHVGYGGVGTLTIADGGAVTVAGGAGTLSITENSDSIGTLNIGSTDLSNSTTGGTVNVANIVFGNGDGDVGTGSINFNQTDSRTVAAAVSGHGTVNQRGTGTTTLTAVNTYTGATNILGGTLKLRSGGSIANSSTVHVASGATLDAAGSFLTFGSAQTLSGAGTVKGEIVVDGTLSVGHAAGSAGLLSFTNSLELTATSFLLIELGGLDRGLSFDAIDVVGDIAFDGTLVVSLLDGFTPTDGDLFQIFDFGGHTRGDFANIVFANGGYTASFNALDGALTLSAIPEPSTYAALAGALVLGLTAWRRRAVRLRRLG